MPRPRRSPTPRPSWSVAAPLLPPRPCPRGLDALALNLLHPLGLLLLVLLALNFFSTQFLQSLTVAVSVAQGALKKDAKANRAEAKRLRAKLGGLEEVCQEAARYIMASSGGEGPSKTAAEAASAVESSEIP